MENKLEQLNDIIDSYINGQYKQMVKQMDAYGLYSVLDDLKQEIEDDHIGVSFIMNIAIAYNKITYR